MSVPADNIVERKHPPPHQQPQYSGGGGGGGGGWGSGIRPRPSSARDPASHASLAYRKVAGNGSGGGRGGRGSGQPDAMQVRLSNFVFPCPIVENLPCQQCHQTAAEPSSPISRLMITLSRPQSVRLLPAIHSEQQRSKVKVCVETFSRFVLMSLLARNLYRRRRSFHCYRWTTMLARTSQVPGAIPEIATTTAATAMWLLQLLHRQENHPRKWQLE